MEILKAELSIRYAEDVFILGEYDYVYYEKWDVFGIAHNDVFIPIEYFKKNNIKVKIKNKYFI